MRVIVGHKASFRVSDGIIVTRNDIIVNASMAFYGIIPFCPSVTYGRIMAKPAQSQDRFIIRLPDGMRDRIAELAKSSGRSMNAEIVARLEQTLDADDALEQLHTRIAELESQVERLSVDTDKRIDRVESSVWRLLEHAGLYDPNPEK